MQREKINLDIIKALSVGNVTPEILKNYSGWGGLRKSLNTPESYVELKNYLSDDEILTIKKTLGNAYYTPRPIIESIYKYLEAQGFTGGNILEPGAGNGAFIEYMPEHIKKKSKIYAVELEPVSAKILTHLYPEITVKNCGFQTMDIKPVFDLVVGNPPYGSEKLFDQYHPDLKHLVIHHYFVAKSMRLLKDGGLLAMVLPSYFLDNKTAHARDIIAQGGGVLVEAFRLPDDLFNGAKVTVDLVFLRKGGATMHDWLNVSQIPVKEASFYMNDFFINNPANILGDLSYVWLNQHQRNQLTCRTNGDVYQKLAKIIAKVKNSDLVNHSDIQSIIKLIDHKMQTLQSRKDQLFQMQSELGSIVQAIESVKI